MPFLTYTDVVDSLTTWARGGALEAEHRDIRQAAYQGYQSVCLDSDFPYLLKHHRIRLDAPYDTGTVSNTTFAISGATNANPIVITSATHGLAVGDWVVIASVAGNTAANGTWRVRTVPSSTTFSLEESDGNGAYTSGGTVAPLRKITLTSGVWPGWTKYGRLVIDDIVYAVTSKDTDTTITLDEHIRPAEQLSSESYTLFRTQYQLPEDFKAGYALYEQDRSWASYYMHPDEWLASERSWLQSSKPFTWTILPDPDRFGCFVLAIHGYPDEVETLDFMYYGRGRDIKLSGYETRCYTGTVAASVNDTTITGTSTQWTSDMVGAVIRFSINTTEYPTGIGDLNPYTEQLKITAVASTTSLTVESPVSQAYSGNLFRISDPIDLDATIVETLKRRAEHELAIYRGTRIELTKQLYDESLYRCLERNARSRIPYCKGDIKAGPWVQWWSRGTIS